MSDLYTVRPDGLSCRMNRETLLIQGWGAGIRVRATPADDFRDDSLSALLPRPEGSSQVQVEGDNASVTMGQVRCEVTPEHRAADRTHIARELQHHIKSLIGVSTTVDVGLPDSIERTLVGKARRVIDRRPK